MYPDLSYFFHDIFGTDVDNWTSIFKTFGLFLVLAILSAAAILYVELKRKAGQGLFLPQKIEVLKGQPASVSELIYNGIFGFVLGFKAIYISQHFAEFQLDPASVLISLKGHWLGGILAGLFFAGIKYWERHKNKSPKPEKVIMDVFPHHKIGDITIIAAIAGVLGSKVFDIIEHIDDFFADPIGTLVSGGGLAIYGGLIFGFIGVAWYLRSKKIPLVPVLDAVAPALIIAYGIGRLGCHFSGDGDWGIPNELAQPGWWVFPDWLWAYDYPQNVIKEGTRIAGCEGTYCFRLDKPVFPTPVYETTVAFAIGGLLWGLRKKITIPGILFFIYLFFNGLERFWIEKIRVNKHYDYFGLDFTQAEFIAVLLMLGGIVGVLFLWRKAQLAKPKEKESS